MEILENYVNALQALENYFGVDNLREGTIEITDAFFDLDKDKVYWSEDKDVYSSEYYSSHIRWETSTEELTLVLVKDDCGWGDYYIIFKNCNRICQ